MDFSALDSFSSLWTAWHATPNIALATDMFVALVFGFMFGYERSYHGRAAGMRTYGLVCMVAAALTSISAHSDAWLSGHALVNPAIVDPTRTIQGIVTGIGFLGAGIIMKDGLKISGLTTAASIWASSAIGVLVGLEFYTAAFIMTLLAELFVLLGSRFDAILPSRRPIFVSLQFKRGFRPSETMITSLAKSNGYDLAGGTLTILSRETQIEWRFVAISIRKRHDIAISSLAEALANVDGLENFQLSRARN